MSATNYTPIQLYYSTTASAVPVNTNLANGELAINIQDEKLYFKNAAGTVKLLASNATSAPVTTFSAGTTGLTPNTATSGAISLGGTLGTANGGTNLTSFTSGGAVYATSTSALTTGTLPIASGGTAQTSFTAGLIHFGSFSTNANFFWDNTNSYLGVGNASPQAKLSVGAGTTAPGFGTVSKMIYICDTTQPELLIRETGGSVVTSMYSDASTGNIRTATNHPLVLQTNNSERMRISATGLTGFGTSTTATSTLQSNGSTSTSALKTPNIAEVDTISATAATGTINYDITTQSVLYYTSNASANWTVNFRGSSGTSLNTLMQTGESISATFLVTQGSTAYYNSAVTIDGTSVTPKWQGGTAPTSGNASSVDCYTYVIQKTGSATYAVLASQTKFA